MHAYVKCIHALYNILIALILHVCFFLYLCFLHGNQRALFLGCLGNVIIGALGFVPYLSCMHICEAVPIKKWRGANFFRSCCPGCFWNHSKLTLNLTSSNCFCSFCYWHNNNKSRAFKPARRAVYCPTPMFDVLLKSSYCSDLRAFPSSSGLLFKSSADESST